MVKKSQAQMEKEWQARSDLDALQCAEQIRTDQARLKAAETMARKDMNALQKIAGKPAARKRGK